MKPPGFFVVIILFLALLLLFGCTDRNCGNNLCETDFGENSLTCPADCGGTNNLNTLNNSNNSSNSDDTFNTPFRYTISWLEEPIQPCYVVITNAAQDRPLRVGVDEYYGIKGSITYFGACEGKNVEVSISQNRYNLNGLLDNTLYVIQLDGDSADQLREKSFNLGYYKVSTENVCAVISLTSSNENMVLDNATAPIRAMPSVNTCATYGSEYCVLQPESTCYEGTCQNVNEDMGYCEFKTEYLEHAIPFYVKDSDLQLSEPIEDLIKPTNPALSFAEEETLEHVLGTIDSVEAQINSAEAIMRQNELSALRLANMDAPGVGGMGGMEIDYPEYEIEFNESTGEPKLKKTITQKRVDLSGANLTHIELTAPSDGYIANARKQLQEAKLAYDNALKAVEDAGGIADIGSDHPAFKTFRTAENTWKMRGFELKALEDQARVYGEAVRILEAEVTKYQNAASNARRIRDAEKVKLVYAARNWAKKFPACKRILKYIPVVGAIIGAQGYLAVGDDVVKKDYAAAADKTMDMFFVTAITREHCKATEEAIKFFNRYDDLKNAIEDDLRQTYTPREEGNYDFRDIRSTKCSSTIDQRATDLYDKEYQDYLKWQRNCSSSSSSPPAN